jgi:hypothetical protein
MSQEGFLTRMTQLLETVGIPLQSGSRPEASLTPDRGGITPFLGKGAYSRSMRCGKRAA